jgi:4-hydroxy 2-oxovalerate aldolase
LPMLSHLKSKGYLVGLNIMQASLRNSVELTKSAEMVTDFGCVDVLYFADSLGSMLESDVVRVFQAITNGWKGDVGFHAHNNMGQAVSNAAVAMDLGCTWIDGTVTGMGRGAGNAQTEYLLENPKLNKTTNTTSLFNLVVKYFDPMKKIYGWGASMPYFLGAKYGLHPTYVQELCSKSQFDKTYLYDVMADLSVTDNPQAFSRSTMENAISKTTNGGIVTGEKAPPIFKGKEVVLVAQTEISSVYKHAIKDYVNAKGAVLVSINLPSSLMDIDYDFVALSHNQKYREDRESYKDKKYKYIAPKKLFSEAEFLVEHDYGICVNGNFFEIYGNYAYVPNRLTIAYAIAFCLDASAEKISLVGFGGYSLGDPRQKEMEQFLSLLSSKAIEIKSLTPTTYSIPEISIYGI